MPGTPRGSRGRIRAVRIAAAVLLSFLAAAALTAGEKPAAPPDYKRVQARLNATYRRIVDEYIAEQMTARDQLLANLMVGSLYESGMVGDAAGDAVVAAEFYERAAAAGSPEANCALGVLYLNGATGPSGSIKRDPARAREYLEKAAEGGSTKAMVELGRIYRDGKDIDPDSSRAMEYFVRAAERGDADALDILEPVMIRAREWEAAKPGRKANFPTRRDDLLKKEYVEANLDRTFNLERDASRIYVEVSRRISAAVKDILKISDGQ